MKRFLLFSFVLVAFLPTTCQARTTVQVAWDNCDNSGVCYATDITAAQALNYKYYLDAPNVAQLTNGVPLPVQSCTATPTASLPNQFTCIGVPITVSNGRHTVVLTVSDTNDESAASNVVIWGFFHPMSLRIK